MKTQESGNLRKGGTDRQKDNIVSFIKDVIYK